MEDAGNPGGGSSSSYSSSPAGAGVGAAWSSLLTGAEVGFVVPLVPTVVVPSEICFMVPLVTKPSTAEISCFVSSMGISLPSTFASPSAVPFSNFTDSPSLSSGYCSPTMHTSWNQSSLHASPRRHWYIVPVSLATS